MPILGLLRGAFGGPRGNGINSDQMLLERFNELSDPNFGRRDFINTLRSLQPTQNDIMSRLRGSGLGLGTSSVLADRQFRAQQSRATGQAANAFTQFRLSNVQNANSVLGRLSQADQFQTQRVDQFDNNILGIGGLLAGRAIGGGGSR